MIKKNKYWLYVTMAALSLGATSSFTYSPKVQADTGGQTQTIKPSQTGSTVTSSGKWGGVCPWKVVGDTLTIGEAGEKYNITTGTNGYNPFPEDVTHVKIQGSITLPDDSSGLFESMDSVVDITGLDKLNTENVKNMGSMFYYDTDLRSLDVSKFNTSNVTDMNEMFYYNTTLKSLDLSNFDTSKVTDMMGMFASDLALESLDVSKFDTSKVTDMGYMFWGFEALPSLDLSNFNTSQVTNMKDMFFYDVALTSLDISHFDTSKVTDMDSMFGQDSMLWKLTLGSKFNNSSLKTLPTRKENAKIVDGNSVRAATGLGWQAVGNGAANNPSGTWYRTNDDFANNRPPETETYVWPQEADQYTLDINENPVSLYQGYRTKNWDPTSVIKSATKNRTDDKSNVTITDSDGKAVTKETVAALKPGTYQLTYNNGGKDGKSQTLDLTILPDKAKLTTTDIDLYLNQKFSENDLKQNISAVDSDGSTPLDYDFTIKDSDSKEVSVDNISANKGKYTVNVTTKRPISKNAALTGTLTINVTDKSTLNLKYDKRTIPVNQAWKPEDAFDNAKDASGKDVAFKDITVTAKNSSGKTISDLNNLYKKPGVYTIHYSNGSAARDLILTVKQATPTPGPTPGPTPSPSPQPTPNPTPTPTPKPVTPTTPGNNNTSFPDYAAKKGAAVYGINNLYLYKKANFTKGQRIAKYVKKPRIYRPMFVVTDYARSITGKLRYKVTDVNHRSKTAGKSGYITASWKYVRPVYYASKHSKITVISPKGVNAYKTEALTGKVKNYKQGTVLNVKGMVKHNLTTRYILTNGKYVTANRKLVNMGRHKTVKKIRAKTTVNRYKNVNLSRRNQTYKKGEVFKVYNYDYSHGYNLQKHGALRYHVAGGYITGNSKYVKVIR